MNAIIPATDSTSLWALMAAGTALAIWLEQSYGWARRIGSPVLALLIAMALANARIVPTQAPAYDVVADQLVPLAIPLLLFRANLREILRSGGRMLFAFHLSVVGTVLGTALAVWLLRGRIGSPNTAYAAGLMAASYIGGGINFVAIKTSYDVPVAVANPLIVADNLVMAGVFVALLGLASSPWMRARFPHSHVTVADGEAADKQALALWDRKGISLLDLAKSGAFAFVVVGLAAIVGRFAQGVFGAATSNGVGWQMLATLCTNKFVLLTAVTLALATVLAGPLSKVNGPDELGTYLLSLFLFTLGLPADLRSILVQAPFLFVFCGVIALFNLLFTLAAGKVLRLHLEEVLLAVNATLGGAPSVAAMAVGAGWPRLVLPGLLAGVWCYVIGTPIGVLVVEFLLR